MKVKSIKKKVTEKIAMKMKKLEAKCHTDPKTPMTASEKIGGVLAVVSPILGLFLIGAVCGCSTADAPTAQRAQSITAKDISITINIASAMPTNAAPVAITFEIATAAQANETSGTETSTATPTQTPTMTVSPTTTVNYGLTSSSASGTSWIDDLTSASAKGLAAILKSGESTTTTVTKTDGTTETVTCKDGTCTTASGDTVTCAECSKQS